MRNYDVPMLIESLFDDFDFFNPRAIRRPPPPMPMPGHMFRNDIIDFEDRVEIHAELPGYTKENVSITTTDAPGGRCLVISASKKDVKEDKEDGKYIRKEIHTGSFEKRFSLRGLNEDKISAEFKDGILKIAIAKITPEEEKETVKKIDIN